MQSTPVRLDAAVIQVDNLLAQLEAIPDERGLRGLRYPLAPLLVVMVLAKLAGEDRPSGIAEWVQHRGDLLREALQLRWARMPHHNTYRRVLAEAIPPGELDRVISAHLRGRPGVGESDLIAIDGKTVRGTIANAGERGEHLLTAYLPNEGIVLEQRAVESKENEIVVAPALLAGLDLRGKVVAGDAMHTQRQVSTQILGAGGDYLWVAKDNQPTLRADIELLFSADSRTVLGGHIRHDFETATSQDKGHGRREIRTITVSSELQGVSDWPGLEQVFRLERQRSTTKSGKTERDIVYGLTSLPRAKASPARLLTLNRAYWGIENGLHHRRDVTFQEDRTRLTLGNAGHVMASLNNLVIGLLRSAGATNVAAARRWCAANLNHLLSPSHACSLT